ncbi:hypothetical protein REH70_12985 [Cellulomonas sp. ATA003]|nr:hypothetical protein [Cellulomonas sp. ATA003]WNB84691.1 hypothetical protein REH70_12985 [Cellulomonas sp. ATA003]
MNTSASPRRLRKPERSRSSYTRFTEVSRWSMPTKADHSATSSDTMSAMPSPCWSLRTSVSIWVATSSEASAGSVADSASTCTPSCAGVLTSP